MGAVCCAAANNISEREEALSETAVEAEKLANAQVATSQESPPAQIAPAADALEWLRVRNAGGSLVLEMVAVEAIVLTVAKVKALVAEAWDKRPEEVILMDGTVALKGSLLMSDLFSLRWVLELQMIIRRLPEIDPQKPLVEQLTTMGKMLKSDCDDLQRNAVLQVRRLISVEDNPPIDDVIAAGLVPTLVELSKAGECSDECQYDAAWALTNVASGISNHVQVLLDAGTMPVFISKLSAESEDLRDQCAWGIGNIAGDSPRFRDVALASGVLQPLMVLLRPSEPPDDATSSQRRVSLLRNATWALSNLCRGRPPPSLQAVSPALEVLPALLASTDEEVVADACWALSYFAEGGNDRIEVVVRSEVCPRLVDLLSHESRKVVLPALRAVGNIVSGDADQTEAILQCGAIRPLLRMVNSDPTKQVKKEACWSISNIMAGTETQIQAVLDAGIGPILQVLEHAEWDVRKEAAWAICNVFSGGSPQQAHEVAEVGLSHMLTFLRGGIDGRLSFELLKAIESMLQKGATLQLEQAFLQNPCLQLLMDAGGKELLYELQAGENAGGETVDKAKEIVRAYFQA